MSFSSSLTASSILEKVSLYYAILVGVFASTGPNREETPLFAWPTVGLESVTFGGHAASVLYSTMKAIDKSGYSLVTTQR